MKSSRAAWVRALPKGARVRVVANAELVELRIADGEAGGSAGLQSGAALKLAEQLLNVARLALVPKRPATAAADGGRDE